MAYALPHRWHENILCISHVVQSIALAWRIMWVDLLQLFIMIRDSGSDGRHLLSSASSATVDPTPDVACTGEEAGP